MVITQNFENVDFREKSLLVRISFPDKIQAKFFMDSLKNTSSEEQKKVVLNYLKGRLLSLRNIN